MNTLVITVGIPGCGKSTYAEHAKQNGIDIVISSDAIREELTGDMENQEQNRDVFTRLNNRVSQALQDGKHVLVDATNLKPAYRKGLKALADAIPRHTVTTCAVRFGISSDYDECQRRNLSRERVVPELVMQRFHAMFLQNCSVQQLMDEGWLVAEFFG